MRVLKFGGTSLQSADSIKKVIEIISNYQGKEKLIVIVSAMAGVTDELIEIANTSLNQIEKVPGILDKIRKRHEITFNELTGGQNNKEIFKDFELIFNEMYETLLGVSRLKELSVRTMDRITSNGEILSSKLLYEALKLKVKNTIYIHSDEYIIAEQNNKQLKVNFKETNRRIAKIKEKNFDIAIAPGYIASDKDGVLTTLGRGGSDYSASIFAAGIKASRLEIWTDVKGIYSADPGLVELAYPIKELSYQEAMELSHFGAKVIYPPTLHPVFSNQIDLYVKSTFSPDAPGTHISKKTSVSGKLIKGLSSISGISLLTLTGSGMVGISGFSARLFIALAKEHINVILISQASSEHSICVAINEEDAEISHQTINEEFAYEMSVLKVDRPVIENDFSIIAIVGENMNKTVGISGKAFNALGNNGINIHAIAQGASELNISLVVKSINNKKALNVLHEEFFLSEVKRINLYIAGVGNVGSKLFELIQKQKSYLLKEKNLDICVKGLMNSKKMIISENKCIAKNWKKSLANGTDRDFDAFVNRVKKDNLRNSIFVDNTANVEVSESYKNFLESSISVVTCNKIAASSEMSNYNYLKKLAVKKRAHFLYESNVGAGLPLIRTINNLKSTGDEIVKIEAALSGSLNFIFNEFYKGVSFRKAVEMAMEAGLTEPDPRIDLSGVDVARKILILARESGYSLEMNDIEISNFIPEECFAADNVSAFIESLDKHEKYFANLLSKAKLAEKRLRVVASFSKNESKIELINVTKESPFYNVEGKDNLVAITTRWYSEQPLIIKGAGAGAEVTASGILSDIISISNV